VDFPWNPVSRRVKAWEGEVPAEPSHAGARCELQGSVQRSAGMRISGSFARGW
jgi:hypothetical protein